MARKTRKYIEFVCERHLREREEKLRLRRPDSRAGPPCNLSVFWVSADGAHAAQDLFFSEERGGRACVRARRFSLDLWRVFVVFFSWFFFLEPGRTTLKSSAVLRGGGSGREGDEMK